MGATTYVHKRAGVSARQVFDELVREAIEEYGHDYYNGTISSARLTRIIDYSSYSPKVAEKMAKKYVDNHIEDVHKCDCIAICTKRVGYDVSSIKTYNVKVSVKSEKKKVWVLKTHDKEYIFDFEHQLKDKVNKLIKEGEVSFKYFQERREVPVTFYEVYKKGVLRSCVEIEKGVEMMKKYTKEDGYIFRKVKKIPGNSYTDVTIHHETKKKKPTSKKGVTVTPIYEYVFFGCAPY